MMISMESIDRHDDAASNRFVQMVQPIDATGMRGRAK
jgi:hypothetical protein